MSLPKIWACDWVASDQKPTNTRDLGPAQAFEPLSSSCGVLGRPVGGWRVPTYPRNLDFGEMDSYVALFLVGVH